MKLGTPIAIPPMNAGEQSDMCEPNNRNGSQTAQRVKRVLIAENDEAMRAFLVKTLRRLGYIVDEVGTSDEMNQYVSAACCSKNAAVLPDLIITGICTPGKTTLDTLIDLKKTVRDIPIVLITVLEEPETQRLAMRLGAAAIFDKPFNIERFKAFLINTVPPTPEYGGSTVLSECEPPLETRGVTGSKLA
jgi:CheY-like chemotaxis protein